MVTRAAADTDIRCSSGVRVSRIFPQFLVARAPRAQGSGLSRFTNQVPLLCLLGLLALLLAACGGGANRPGQPASVERGPPVTGAAKDVLFTALALVGTPYRYGGNNPAGGFDCSGLVGYVYREAAALQLPRSTREIAAFRAREVKRKQLRSGDLVLFGKRRVDHIGIYVGEGRFVHAPSTGGTVRLDHLEGPYWRDRWAGGKRLL